MLGASGLWFDAALQSCADFGRFFVLVLLFYGWYCGGVSCLVLGCLGFGGLPAGFSVRLGWFGVGTLVVWVLLGLLGLFWLCYGICWLLLFRVGLV